MGHINFRNLAPAALVVMISCSTTTQQEPAPKPAAEGAGAAGGESPNPPPPLGGTAVDGIRYKISEFQGRELVSVFTNGPKPTPPERFKDTEGRYVVSTKSKLVIRVDPIPPTVAADLEKYAQFINLWSESRWGSAEYRLQQLKGFGPARDKLTGGVPLDTSIQSLVSSATSGGAGSVGIRIIGLALPTGQTQRTIHVDPYDQLQTGAFGLPIGAPRPTPAATAAKANVGPGWAVGTPTDITPYRAKRTAVIARLKPAVAGIAAGPLRNTLDQVVVSVDKTLAALAPAFPPSVLPEFPVDAKQEFTTAIADPGLPKDVKDILNELLLRDYELKVLIERNNAINLLNDATTAAAIAGLTPANFQPGVVDVATSGLKNGDGLIIKIARFSQDGKGAFKEKADIEERWDGVVQESGAFWSAGADAMFSRAKTGDRDETSWKLNTAALLHLGYRIPDPQKDLSYFWNWLEPTVGIHVASLNQTSQSAEFGIGANVGLWGGYLNGGFGGNLSNHGRRYYFVGLDLLQVLQGAMNTKK